MPFEVLEKLLTHGPYELGGQAKEEVLLAATREVAGFHYEHCKPYRSLCEARRFSPDRVEALKDVPYLPVALFKNMLLTSVPRDEVFREINSSATSTGSPSRIALDRATSRRQTKCLNRVIVDRLGDVRRPFLVLDVPSSIHRSEVVSARSSMIKSLLVCASETSTCLEEKNGTLRADLDRIQEFLGRAQAERQPVVIFGFTYILYAYVLRRLMEQRVKFDLPGSLVIHIGGWKRLEAERVSPEKLGEDCASVFGIRASDVVDIYGFTEQAGVVYPTCEYGVRHAPVWAEVIARDPVSLEPTKDGEQGLLQFITPIQTSYPGHSVLTEDLGRIVRRDYCPCGRSGTGFVVQGRAPRAEIRGCGDIMAERFA